MAAHTPKTWRHEESTKTIRSVPGNHWIATMDSWDGACNHHANARLIAAAPELLEALMTAKHYMDCLDKETGDEKVQEDLVVVRAAITKATVSTISGGEPTEGIQRGQVRFATVYKIGDQIQSIETNWQGRVTGFDKMDGDDCTYLVCHHVCGGEIELDDKRWFDPRDVRLLRCGQ